MVFLLRQPEQITTALEMLYLSKTWVHISGGPQYSQPSDPLSLPHIAQRVPFGHTSLAQSLGILWALPLASSAQLHTSSYRTGVSFSGCPSQLDLSHRIHKIRMLTQLLLKVPSSLTFSGSRY